MSSRWIALFPAVMFAPPAYADTPAEELISATRDRMEISDDECRSTGRVIVVCARENENDRYRLPFETAEAGDPDNEGVWGERYRIQANPGHCQGWEQIQYGCGAVGVSFSTGAGGSQLSGGMRTAQ